MATVAIGAALFHAWAVAAASDADLFLDVRVRNRFFSGTNSLPAINVRLRQEATMDLLAFDRTDRLGRIEILAVHLRDVKTSPDVDPEQVAALTPGFTGADRFTYRARVPNLATFEDVTVSIEVTPVDLRIRTDRFTYQARDPNLAPSAAVTVS